MKKIGILISNKEQIFTNGCVQQPYFTRKVLLNAGFEVDLLSANKKLDTYVYPDIKTRYITLDQNMNDLDAILFIGSSVSNAGFKEKCEKNNIYLISQISGNFFFLLQEDCIMGKNNSVNLFEANYNCDELWMLPMYDYSTEFIKTLTKQKVTIMPYIWDSDIIKIYEDKTKYKIKDTDDFALCIFEPNVSLHKNCLIPVLIAEKVYEFYPNNLKKVYIFCKPSHDCFKKLVNHLNIVNIIEYHPKYPIYNALDAIKNTDYNNIIIGNQWKNNLNFIYFEMFYLGYPLVHNCENMKNVGYYYNNFDLTHGAQAVSLALNGIKQKDINGPYVKQLLNKYSPDNDENIQKYKNILLHTIENYQKKEKKKSDNIKTTENSETNQFIKNTTIIKPKPKNNPKQESHLDDIKLKLV